MYALKRVRKMPDGRHVEESFILGNMYRLEFYPKENAEPGVVVRIEYSQNGSTPVFDIKADEQAYITTLTGDTVRILSRSKMEAVR